MIEKRLPMKNHVVLVDKNDAEIGSMEKLEATKKDFFTGHSPFLSSTTTANSCSLKEQRRNTIPANCGVIPVAVILTQAKTLSPLPENGSRKK